MKASIFSRNTLLSSVLSNAENCGFMWDIFRSTVEKTAAGIDILLQTLLGIRLDTGAVNALFIAPMPYFRQK